MVEIGLRFILYLLVYKKEDENDMVVVVAQHERNNIKYHASTFSCEFKFLYLIFQH